jgi:ribosomal protein L32
MNKTYGNVFYVRSSARNEEPMEVDHLQQARIFQLCNLKGHTAKSKDVNEKDCGESKDSNRICYACGERGNIRVNCRKKP